METLNLPTSIEHIVPIVEEVRRLMRGRREGLVFSKLNGSTRMASDYIGRYRKLAGIETRVRINFSKLTLLHISRSPRTAVESASTSPVDEAENLNKPWVTHYDGLTTRPCQPTTRDVSWKQKKTELPQQWQKPDSKSSRIANARIRYKKQPKKHESTRKFQKAHSSSAKPVENSDSDSTSADESDKENKDSPNPTEVKARPAQIKLKRIKIQPAAAPVETRPDAPVEKPIEIETPKEDSAPARRARNARKPARFRDSEEWEEDQALARNPVRITVKSSNRN